MCAFEFFSEGRSSGPSRTLSSRGTTYVAGGGRAGHRANADDYSCFRWFELATDRTQPVICPPVPPGVANPRFKHVETDTEPKPEAVAAIHKHVAWLVRDGLLTPDAASDMQRALERALAESREDHVAIVALVDGLLHAVDEGLLPSELFVVDLERGVARFHLAATLAALVAAQLLTRAARERLRRLLPVVAEWLPDAGLGSIQQRFTFARLDRRRGFELDLVKARAFLKRTEAVPSR